MTEVTNKVTRVKSEYLYELLQRIKERPGMYLGRCSITRLSMFLMGYGMARMELGLSQTEQEREFDGFQEWIQKRFNIKSSHGWDSIILFYSADEREALDNFFELFERFLNKEHLEKN